MTELYRTVGDNLFESLQTTDFLLALGFAFLCGFCLLSFVRALLGKRSKGWNSTWFLWLCACVFWWGLLWLLSYIVPAGSPLGAQFFSLRYLGLIFVPGLVCMHVWKQVYYKELSWYTVVGFLAVPMAVAIVGIVEMAQGQVYVPGYDWKTMLLALYAVVSMARAYLLCFDVFYQMPQHMRRSTYFLLFGITAITVAIVVLITGQQEVLVVLSLVALCIAMLCFMEALNKSKATNVAVTSRYLVFGNLSTTILVLGQDMEVLDWNKKGPGAIAPLPQPRYMEAFSHYRQRIIEEGKGKVSPHGENIISATFEGTEHNYLISIAEVRQTKRSLGYIVEISDVSNLYSTLRYIEEIAAIDQLTGLYNRNAYLNMVRQLTRPQYLPLIVVVGDVNRLKYYNDNFGHLYGDDLLITVAETIKQSVPKHAFVARIGGDEFVVLLPGGASQDAVTFIREVERRCGLVSDKVFGRPSISWGYAQMNEGDQYNDVFARADRIMYTMKRSHQQFRPSGMVPEPQAAQENPYQPPVATAQVQAEKQGEPPREEPAEPPPQGPEPTPQGLELLPQGLELLPQGLEPPPEPAAADEGAKDQEAPAAKGL